MTVLFCGSRDWTAVVPIRHAVAALPAGTVVIHGGARGADTIAGQEAKRRGLEVRVYPALWKKHGRAAGPMRNQQMLDEGKPSEVYAFRRADKPSVGTRDMVQRARSAGVPVREFLDYD